MSTTSPTPNAHDRDQPIMRLMHTVMTHATALVDYQEKRPDDLALRYYVNGVSGALADLTVAIVDAQPTAGEPPIQKFGEPICDTSHELANGGREVMPGLVAKAEGRPWGTHVTCMNAHIEATDDEDAAGRMVRLRNLFAGLPAAEELGLRHLQDADGC